MEIYIQIGLAVLVIATLVFVIRLAWTYGDDR